MSPKSAFCQLGRAAVITFSFVAGYPVSPAHAAPLYYDTSNTSGLTAGTATWDASTTSAWQTSATPGTAAPGLWTNGETATFQTNSTNTVTVSGTVIAEGIAQTASGGTGTTISGGTIQLGTTGLSNTTGGTKTLTINSAINLATAATTFNPNDSGRPITLGGSVGELTAGSAISKTGVGVLTFNAVNTYTGNTNISAGTIRVGVDNAINSASAVNFTTTTSSKLEVIASTVTIAGLSSVSTSNNLIVNTGAATNSNTLIIDTPVSTSYTFAGMLTNGSGTLNLVKNGLGTQTITKSSVNNDFTGTVTVNNGVLAYGSAAAFAGGSEFTITTPGTLAYNLSLTQTQLNRVATASTGTIALGTASNSSALSFTGRDGLYLGSTGSFTYSAAAGSFTPGAPGYLLGGGGGTLTIGTSNLLTGAVPLTVRGNVTLGVGQNYSGATTVSSGTLLVNNTSNSGTGTAGVTVASGATLGGTGTIAPTVIGGINVSGVLAPGSGGIGNLTIDLTSATSGTVGMLTSSSFAFELGTANLSIGTIGLNSSDLLTLAGASSGDFAFNGNNVNFLSTGAVGFYKLFDTSSDNANTWAGLNFDGTTGKVNAGLTYSNLAGGLTGDFLVGTASNGGTTGDIYFQVVPEPNAAALLGSIGMLALLRRRRD